MKFKRKISKWGGSTGITLPQDLLLYIGLKSGDRVTIEDMMLITGEKYIKIKKDDDEDTEPTSEV